MIELDTLNPGTWPKSTLSRPGELKKSSLPGFLASEFRPCISPSRSGRPPCLPVGAFRIGRQGRLSPQLMDANTPAYHVIR